MDNPHSPSPLRESDYEAIEAAVMETEKGRWFLAEFARRNRAADTDAVLAAIGRLEGMMRRERGPDVDRIRLDVAEMKDAIDRTKAEIAEIRQDGSDGTRFERATSELDSIITQTEAATSEILGAAEKLQEVAWTMREGGVDGEVCDAVEALVMTIYTACSFQDLTGQRTQKVVRVLRYLESRIDEMVRIWGMDGGSDRAGAPARSADARPDAHLLNGPPAPGEGIDQDTVDGILDEDDFVSWSEPETLALLPPADPAGTPADTAGPAPVEADEVAFEAAPAAAAPPEPDGADADPLAAASAAMEDAIETLREVAAGIAGRADLADSDDDPLARLGRAERQALFS